MKMNWIHPEERDWLLKFQSQEEMKQQQQQQQQQYHDVSNDSCKRTRSMNSPPIDMIRDIPELMIQVYSFLSIKDRIRQLSLVDKQFALCNIRKGFRVGIYDGLSSCMLPQAIQKLYNAVIARETTNSLVMVFVRQEYPDIPTNIKFLVRKIQKEICNNAGGIIPIADDCCNGYTNNIKHEKSAKLIDKHFDPINRLKNGKPHWLLDIASMHEFHYRLFYGHDEYNQLQQLIDKEDFCLQQEFTIIRSMSKLTSAINNGQKLFYRLDPGYILFLPDIDCGFQTLKFVHCSQCNDLHQLHRKVTCHHNNWGYMCQHCDHLASIRQPTIDPATEVDVRQSWVCGLCDEEEAWL